MGEFTFFNPSLEDVTELARTHVRCWRETYRELLSSDVLDAYTEENRRRMWTNVVTTTPEQVLLVRNTEELVGFASWKRVKDLQTEITTLYVLKDFQGKGLGKRLVSLINDSRPKDEEIGAWVLVGNPSAAFYERMGFKPVATRKNHCRHKKSQKLIFLKILKHRNSSLIELGFFRCFFQIRSIWLGEGIISFSRTIIHSNNSN